MVGLDPIPARLTSLTETVYERIRTAIVTRQIPPGEQVTEAGLGVQLAVSKTPVREALVRLAYIGFVEPGPRRGLRVVTPSLPAIRAAYEVRAGLEAQSVRLASLRRGDSEAGDIANLAQSSFDAVRDGDVTAFRELDRRFHLAIADAAGNARLGSLVRDYVDLVATLRLRDVPQVDNSLECAQHHVSIAAAITERTPDAAEQRLREHLSKVQSLVEAGFSRRNAEAAAPGA